MISYVVYTKCQVTFLVYKEYIFMIWVKLRFMYPVKEIFREP